MLLQFLKNGCRPETLLATPVIFSHILEFVGDIVLVIDVKFVIVVTPNPFDIILEILVFLNGFLLFLIVVTCSMIFILLDFLVTLFDNSQQLAK